MSKHTILIVEDEKVQRETLVAHFTGINYDVLSAETAEEAITIISSKTVDVVVTDFNLPGRDGQYLLEQVNKINPTIPVIFITAYGSVDGAVHAMQEGAYHYLTKPINIDELFLTIKRALQHKTLVSENIRLRETLEKRYSFDGIIASSQKMEEVLNMAARVAETKASILLFGESGTGKEVIAGAIHHASTRKEGPFVAFNVAALSPTLIESELFGHEKGAFTGADRQRTGRFEQAHTGTIFIDEIGDVPLEIQTKFLRVLQENYIERLGGDKKIDVDIRVIAATNKDLESMIKKGTFREDLYYRLNVVSIRIPPLRERKDDIPNLSNHFLKKYSERNKKNIDGISREAFDAIIKYDFPGNVRELENMVERAVILCRGSQITLDDLPQNIFVQSTEQSDENTDGLSLGEKVEAVEKREILAALKRCGGNQSKAARQLQMTERKLRYKIQKYNLDSK
jgi:two-component system NtrC family response regulator